MEPPSIAIADSVHQSNGEEIGGGLHTCCSSGKIKSRD
jgi:hypothetical protein